MPLEPEMVEPLGLSGTVLNRLQLAQTPSESVVPAAGMEDEVIGGGAA